MSFLSKQQRSVPAATALWWFYGFRAYTPYSVYRPHTHTVYGLSVDKFFRSTRCFTTTTTFTQSRRSSHFFPPLTRFNIEDTGGVYSRLIRGAAATASCEKTANKPANSLFYERFGAGNAFFFPLCAASSVGRHSVLYSGNCSKRFASSVGASSSVGKSFSSNIRFPLYYVCGAAVLGLGGVLLAYGFATKQIREETQHSRALEVSGGSLSLSEKKLIPSSLGDIVSAALAKLIPFSASKLLSTLFNISEFLSTLANISEFLSTPLSTLFQHLYTSFSTPLFTSLIPPQLSQLISTPLSRPPSSRCCGIVGYIGNDDAISVLLDGISVLQNRGYDSCGVTTVDPESGELITSKFASQHGTADSISMLMSEAPEVHKKHKIGIAHTRWATHGPKTSVNAHPHHDYKNRISVIHNGTIDNYRQLKDNLMDQRKIPFLSETDTEVIANLIGSYLDDGYEEEEAVTQAVCHLEGTWGLCVLCHKDERLILARNGSPLLVASSANGKEIYVASEPTALVRFTNQYIVLNDGEIAVVTRSGIQHLCETRPFMTIEMGNVELSPDPYPHWTLKEIYEQPESLARALNYGGRFSTIKNEVKLGGLDRNLENLKSIKSLLLTGCGTSLHAAMMGEKFLEWLNAVDTVRAVDAAEISTNMLHNGDGIVLLSQSGETLDTVRASQLAESKNLKQLSVVNAVGSMLARLTGCGVYLNAGREVAVASTKSFTSQVCVLALISVWFAQRNLDRSLSDRVSTLVDAIHKLPVCAGMTLGIEDACAGVAEKIKDARTVFVLGKGFGYPAALEGALKIKEISYIHAEGFSGAALKHGPFALIDEKERTPVILLVLPDDTLSVMMNAAEQVKARGARVICITTDSNLVKHVADDILVVPRNGPLTALLCSIPIQLIAYHLSLKKGINPDNPRGLAKTVTVF